MPKTTVRTTEPKATAATATKNSRSRKLTPEEETRTSCDAKPLLRDEVMAITGMGEEQTVARLLEVANPAEVKRWQEWYANYGLTQFGKDNPWVFLTDVYGSHDPLPAMVQALKGDTGV